MEWETKKQNQVVMRVTVGIIAVIDKDPRPPTMTMEKSRKISENTNGSRSSQI